MCGTRPRFLETDIQNKVLLEPESYPWLGDGARKEQVESRARWTSAVRRGQAARDRARKSTVPASPSTPTQRILIQSEGSSSSRGPSPAILASVSRIVRVLHRGPSRASPPLLCRRPVAGDRTSSAFATSHVLKFLNDIQPLPNCLVELIRIVQQTQKLDFFLVHHPVGHAVRQIEIIG